MKTMTMMMMMLLLMLRVRMRDRVFFGNGHHEGEGLVVATPLNPTTSPSPPMLLSLAFGWSDLEMVLSARAVRSQWPVGPLRSHHISCFGLLVCLSTFCTELKYVKMLFFKFLTKTLITLEPFDRFKKFQCLLIPLSKHYIRMILR